MKAIIQILSTELVPTPTYHLSVILTRAEAAALRTLFEHIGGNLSGPRAMTDRLNYILAGGGIPLVEYEAPRHCDSFYFANDWAPWEEK